MPSILGNGFSITSMASSTAEVFSDGIFSPVLIFLVAGAVALIAIEILTKILHKK